MLHVFTRATLASAELAMERWLAGGWVSVTRRYCVKTAKPILKLFRPSGSPSTLSFLIPCADTQFQGEPCHIPLKLPKMGVNRQFQAKRAKSQQMLTNPRDAHRGQSKPPNIVPFHMLDIVSSCAIVKCRDLEIRVRGHSRSLKVVAFDRLRMISCVL